MEPVTKEVLLEGILKMFAQGALNTEITLGQIKMIAKDERFNWKELSK